MNEIEQAMWDAWEKVGKRLREDPDELRARLARRRSLMYRRPLRAFCLAVRAGDLRITPWRAAMAPEHAMDKRAHDGKLVEHEVTLDARLLRELCAPVRIEPPGEPWFDVAKRLGCRYSAMQAMRRNGSLRVHYYKFAWRRGKATPMVYTPHALDPGAAGKEEADPIWRHLWQYHAESLEDDVSQTLMRWPDYREIRGRVVFGGWRWECPGCGRWVSTVYYPIRPPDWAEYVGFKCEDDEADEAAGPMPCFACNKCHGVIRFSRAMLRKSWNQLVLHYSGGLMYGKEVKRPAWLKADRKREYVRRPKESKRRKELLRYLVGTDLSMGQIAREMGVKYDTVKTVASRIYREHLVHSREALRGVARVEEDGEECARLAG